MGRRTEFSARALGRAARRLIPPDRQDWTEALWAESGEVRPGLARLAWRAGGLRLIAREALRGRRALRALAFAAAAVWVARSAWPGPASNPATAVNRLSVVVLLPVLALLPLLARWRFGPVAPGLTPRLLRLGAYASVLTLALAKAGVEQVRDNLAFVPYLNPDASVPGSTGMIDTWLVESLFLLVVTVYVAAVLAMTARRARVAPATLAVGTGAGAVLGAVMYLVAPLGLTSDATSPWLHGRATDPLVVLAWILLFGAPLAAAGLATARARLPRGALARLREGVAAGFLATGVGALLVTVAGTATVALMPQPGRTLRWPHPGLHQLAAVARSAEVTASIRTDGYGLVLLAFPVIGLLMGALPYLHSLDDGQPHQPPPRPPGSGPPGPDPAPPATGLVTSTTAHGLPNTLRPRLPKGSRVPDPDHDRGQFAVNIGLWHAFRDEITQGEEAASAARASFHGCGQFRVICDRFWP